MALPPAKDLAYRGINTGNAESMAYRGWVITIKVISAKVLRFTVSITTAIYSTITRST